MTATHPAPADTQRGERTQNSPYITGTEAAKRAGVVLTTIANWATRHPELGVKVMGRWRIYPSQLQRILNGELSRKAGQ